MSSRPLPDKLFFKIGEVAQIVGVKPHVLRYWESEFPSLRPMKTRGSHRVYRRQDVELVMSIARLLHDEGYTIAGARKSLRQKQRAGSPEAKRKDPGVAREVALRAELLAVRRDLSELLGKLDSLAGPERKTHGEVTVKSVVPSVAARRRPRER